MQPTLPDLLPVHNHTSTWTLSTHSESIQVHSHSRLAYRLSGCSSQSVQADQLTKSWIPMNSLRAESVVTEFHAFYNKPKWIIHPTPSPPVPSFVRHTFDLSVR